MFSLTYDVFYPIFASAKNLANIVLIRRKPPPAPSSDPRERNRIRMELRRARVEEEARAIRQRYHVF